MRKVRILVVACLVLVLSLLITVPVAAMPSPGGVWSTSLWLGNSYQVMVGQVGAIRSYPWQDNGSHSILAVDVSQEGIASSPDHNYGAKYRVLISSGTEIKIPSIYPDYWTQARYLLLLIYPSDNLFIDTTWQTFSKPVTIQKYVGGDWQFTGGSWQDLVKFTSVVQGRPVPFISENSDWYNFYK